MGFFTTADIAKTCVKVVSTDALHSNCEACGLDKNCEHPKIDYVGKGKKRILIVGESSNDEEDLYGTAFVEEEKEFLQDKLKAHKISLMQDCWRVNAVRCQSASHIKPPTQKQIDCCHPHLEKLIRTLKPKVIFVMGGVGLNSLFGKDFSDRTVTLWRKYCIPDEKYKCHIIPLYHPRFILRNKNDKNLKQVFIRDLRFAVSRLKLEFKPPVDYQKYVKVLTDYKRVTRLLKKIIKRKPKLMFDYETTGRKPYRDGHKIVSIGLALSAKKAFAFPFDYKSFWTEQEMAEIKRLWAMILRDKGIKKMAHNAKFEEIWSIVCCGARPEWHFDTMMAEHILDNRARSIGLKFQTFVRHGVRPYDKIIKPYLIAKKGEFNTVEDAPFKDLLIYNGLDCIFAWMLYERQIRHVTKMRGLLRAYNFWMEGSKVMATLQMNGIAMNTKYYKKTERILDKKVKRLTKKLEKGREARAFKKRFGRFPKITSNQDLGKLFYEVLGKDPVYTAKGQYKTDKSTLEALNLPFVDKLRERKKWEKARGTYLGQFSREIFRNVMHPFFDLHIPISYRGSCSGPNFQNIPKREPEVGYLVRKGIIPRPKGCLSEIDFSGAEVITSATYHKDPMFIKYLTDKSTDMHRDNATDIWMLPPNMLTNPDYDDKQKKLAKMVRFFAKNDWTFAQFYGDWFKSCAEMLWEDCVLSGQKLPTGQTIQSWLEKKGIYELGEVVQGEGPTEGSFMEHCAHVEDKMWNERFPIYTKWKEDIVESYQQSGYIENHFGFRFTGYMNKNQCTNFPIQSASFHLLVYTLIEVQKFIKRKKLKTKLIGNIHDSIISDVPANEIKVYHKGVSDIVASLQSKFKWLIIPMEVEMEISKVREKGGNFAELHEFTLDEIMSEKHEDFIYDKEVNKKSLTFY